jgi:sarcosine oxidase subunit gamma
LGVDLPSKPGQSRQVSDKAHVLCLAPDWWLLVGFPEAGEKLAALRLNEEHHFSAVDVSGQRTTIEVEGPMVNEVLSHLWDQDLRDKSFPAGSVSQGLLAKSPVIVFREAPLTFRVMVRSSFAVNVWEALVDAAEEYHF